MARRCQTLILLAGLAVITSCQEARQYPPLGTKADSKSDTRPDPVDKNLHELSWLEPAPTNDLPLVFVSEASPEWQQLPFDWNHYPPLPVYLGLPPMQSLAAVVLSEHHRVIKIKVPRGLPDPTPNIPATNPPTYGKWRLGKELFFTPFVKVGSKTYSCATCHDPRRGFAGDPGTPTGTPSNTLSLINVVYNRRQFWDGRVQTLEETLFQSADDEREAASDKRFEKGLATHVWPGFARTIRDDGRFHQQFIDIFGVKQPTQDAIARALATYMRTLLTGDSLYDRAEQMRRNEGASALTAKHFAAHLADEASAWPLRESGDGDKPKRDEMPALLVKGHALFHGKARCSQCHGGPLFTDHDFHNIGLNAKENWPDAGKETGRAVHVPVGLKDARLTGAFRTPSLRNLPGRNPYFHDGSKRTLREAIDFFDVGVLPAPHLTALLKDDARPRRLELTAQEKDALVIFVRSLQGRRVDAVLLTP